MNLLLTWHISPFIGQTALNYCYENTTNISYNADARTLDVAIFPTGDKRCAVLQRSVEADLVIQGEMLRRILYNFDYNRTTTF